MSLYGALFSGVSGLNAQSTKLSIISDNISNVNTVGYKQGSSVFETLVTGASSNVSYSPGGVLGGNRQLINQQGLLQSTNSPTDVAIQGGGFFVVNQSSDGSGQVLYTRAGSFTQDSTGNFKNSAGLFLQAWPLDRNGNLPGEAGNITNTTSSANLASLQTVNVNNLTGAAAATTSVSLGANFKASEATFPGAGATASMDAQDGSNFNLTATSIIVPTAVDSLTNGDKFTVSTGAGLSYNFTYGGYTFSRNISTGAVGDTGTALQAAVTLPSGADFTFNSATPNLVTVNSDPTALGLHIGSVIDLSGTAAGGLAINGITSLDGTAYVTAVSGSSNFTIQLPTTAPQPTALSLTGATFTVGIASHAVVISGLTVPTGLRNGDTVHIAGAPNFGGLTGSTDINGDCVVSAVTTGAGGQFTITVAGTSNGAGGTTAGGVNASAFDLAGHITAASVTSRLFDPSGHILDATSPTDAFLGQTTTAGFSNAALSFTITTASTGTSTFKYVAANPTAANGEFTTLNNLATAINNVSGLSARIVNNQLYVSAINGDDSISFANGSTVGVNSSSGPPLAGIDWIAELGLAPVGSASGRFSTLQGLANQINLSPGISATVDNPLGKSDVKIDVTDPLDTISFADKGTNTGSVLAQLGIATTVGIGSVHKSVGPLGPSYDPSVSAKNMASGAITPDFTHSVTIFDARGSAHSVTMSFLKTGNNTWASEIYAPATELNSALPDGQIATGNVFFNGDGTLRSVDPSLLQPISIAWTNGALPSTVTFAFGTAGQPFGTPNAVAIGKADGLGQFDSDYKVNTVKQNGTPVGDLTGVTIDEKGFITASFSNGETQKLYKIPLASFADPNELQNITGDSFLQSSASGEVNLTQAGTNGVGTISSSSLEASNVELANQLTDMIVAQRAYQANTKVISTADQLLSDLDQIIQ